MEEIILRELSSLQLYQVPVALRMILLKMAFAFWAFGFLKYRILFAKTCVCVLGAETIFKWTQTLGTRLLAESLLSWKAVHQPLRVGSFWQLSFHPFLVRRLSRTRSIAAFFDAWVLDKDLLFFLSSWMNELNMLFVMLKVSTIKIY